MSRWRRIGGATASAVLAAACGLSGLDGLTSGGTSDAGVGATGADAAASGADAFQAEDALATTTAADAYRAAVLLDHPVAYYRLGDTGQVAKDEMGAHDGRYVGTPSHTTGAMPGDVGGAFEGDGAVWIDLGAPFPFTGNAPYSLEAWIAPEVGTTLVGVVARNLSTGGTPVDGYSLYLDNTRAPTMGRWASSTEEFAVAPTIRGNAYHHVVGTYDSTTLRIYVDGALATMSDAPSAVIAAAADVTIGASRNGTYGYFVGAIDEVAIYDHALTPDRVAAHHAAAGF